MFVIFKDPMATAAAIDCLVHHAGILEFDVASFRADRTQTREAVAPPTQRGCPPKPLLAHASGAPEATPLRGPASGQACDPPPAVTHQIEAVALDHHRQE